MANLPCFDSAHLEATCKVLGDTTHGLTGTEIRHILCETNVADLFPQLTKWKRLYNALAEKQNQVHAGNFVIQFINKAMAPAKRSEERRVGKECVSPCRYGRSPDH